MDGWMDGCSSSWLDDALPTVTVWCYAATATLCLGCRPPSGTTVSVSPLLAVSVAVALLVVQCSARPVSSHAFTYLLPLCPLLCLLRYQCWLDR